MLDYHDHATETQCRYVLSRVLKAHRSADVQRLLTAVEHSGESQQLLYMGGGIAELGAVVSHGFAHYSSSSNSSASITNSASELYGRVTLSTSIELADAALAASSSRSVRSSSSSAAVVEAPFRWRALLAVAQLGHVYSCSDSSSSGSSAPSSADVAAAAAAGADCIACSSTDGRGRQQTVYYLKNTAFDSTAHKSGAVAVAPAYLLEYEAMP
jgi:methylmalonyl-CoA mutase cobalamin-binding subunit